MRAVTLPGTDLVTSPLGMGCASLGSRVGARQGRRALDAAFERGVLWYDVAPAYGAGDAELIVAPFLAGRRDRVFVCSKVGLSPPQHNGLVKLAYRVGRPVIGLAQGLRRSFRKVSATRNVRVPLTPDLIEASLHRSLKRLGTDYLDVFALHDPDPADFDRDEIVNALEALKQSGKVRYVSVAGTAEAALRAAAYPVFGLFQLADDPVARPLQQLRARIRRPAGFVTHSVLGVGGAQDRLVGRLADARVRAMLAEAGYAGDPASVATRLLMRRAFASNSEGVVLASMFSGRHLAENVALASAAIDPDAVRLVDRALGISS